MNRRRASLFVGAAAFVAMIGCAHPRSRNVAVGPVPPPLEAPHFADPGDRPEIVAVWLSSDTARAGNVVQARVQTSTNVASVVLRVESLSRKLTRSREDLFTGSVLVPTLPAVLRRSYELQVVARNSAGRVERVYIPVQLR